MALTRVTGLPVALQNDYNSVMEANVGDDGKLTAADFLSVKTPKGIHRLGAQLRLLYEKRIFLSSKKIKEVSVPSSYKHYIDSILTNSSTDTNTAKAKAQMVLLAVQGPKKHLRAVKEKRLGRLFLGLRALTVEVFENTQNAKGPKKVLIATFYLFLGYGIVWNVKKEKLTLPYEFSKTITSSTPTDSSLQKVIDRFTAIQNLTAGIPTIESKMKPAVQPDIFTAIANGSESELEASLKRQPKWQKLYWDGLTPLHAALSKPDLLALLLKAKPNFSVKSLDGASPLHLAIKNDQADAVGKLLQSKHPLHVKDPKGNTPLMASLNQNELPLDKSDPSNILLAKKRTSITDSLLKSRAVDVHTPNDIGDTPLLLAIDAKNILWVTTIAAKNPSTKVEEEYLDSYLIKALRTKVPEIVSAVASLKPKLRITEMEEAVGCFSSAKCLRALLQHYKTIPRDENGEHYIYHVTSDFKRLKIFFECGYSPYIKDKQGKTVLSKIVRTDSYQALEAYDTLLSSNKFNINSVLENGFRLLDLLLLKNASVEAIQKALDRGADPSLKAPANKMTSLQLAEDHYQVGHPVRDALIHHQKTL